MKELSNTQIEQVSGAGNLGSLMSLLGMKTVGTLVHGLESSVYNSTLGRIPLVGSMMKGLFTDVFGQFKTNTPAK